MADSSGACPYCGQPIGRDELGRIEEHEHKRLEAAVAQANAEAEGRHQSEMEDVTGQLRTAKQQIDNLPNLLEQKLEEERVRLAAEAKLDQEDRIKELEDRVSEAEGNAKEEAEGRVTELKDQNNRLIKSFTLIEDQLARSEKGAEDLQRQLQKTRAPHETGGLAEEELERQLRAEFPRDHIQRTPRGASGADLAQHVSEEGVDCGDILYECKDTKTWQPTFVSKLAKDKTNVGAAYAILVSTAMPPKSDGLAVLDGVTVVQPRFVIDLVRIVRDALVIAGKGKAASQDSGYKGEELLLFLQSPDFTNKVKAALRAVGELETLQTQEKRRHELLWQKQTAAQANVRKQINDVQTEVTRIIVGS